MLGRLGDLEGDLKDLKGREEGECFAGRGSVLVAQRRQTAKQDEVETDGLGEDPAELVSRSIWMGSRSGFLLNSYFF